MPKFVYFADYLRLPGQVSFTDLKNRTANNTLRGSDNVFLAYLALIGAKVEDLENNKEFERLTRELEGASNHLTAKMKKYWSQNRHLRVNCRFDVALAGDPAPFNTGHVARTRIENTRHGVTTSFDERSAGFVWFFSFLVWFSQVKRQYGDRLIILLDEPGLSLHAKAQHDLLRYIEKELEPDHQVIYTTHSPFLIDPEHLLRARTVEDVFIDADEENGIEEQDLGTKVGDDVLSTDRDTVFPLQACLGYEITQTLFVGKHTLIVEGPSDLLYLTWFRAKLAAAGRTTLDRRWTITPCGGIDKVAAFVALFGGENSIHVAVLTDLATGVLKATRRGRFNRFYKQAENLACMGFDRVALIWIVVTEPVAAEELKDGACWMDAAIRAEVASDLLQGQLQIDESQPFGQILIPIGAVPGGLEDERRAESLRMLRTPPPLPRTAGRAMNQARCEIERFVLSVFAHTPPPRALPVIIRACPISRCGMAFVASPPASRRCPRCGVEL